MSPPDLSLDRLKASYAAETATPESVIQSTYDAIESRGPDATWIHLLPRELGLQQARAREVQASSALPLRGIPFAIKDNIDLGGVPTTAACPGFAYTPTQSAPVVARLVAAGAIPIGKTNLDQFATGLVGVRSPYGIPKNPYHADYIPGGSSSGSAVAVAAGLSSFSLGTDTAGSGRIPAMFNGLVGLKPTRGLLSTRGVVPACRSLDCVSIFAKSCRDAGQVLGIAAAFDPEDPFSRPAPAKPEAVGWPLRIGIPRPDQLEFFGNPEAAALFNAAVERWSRLGCTVVEVDFEPFRAAARLLYEGAWVAERYAALRTFLERSPEAVFPVTRQIIEGARRLSAADAFDSIHRLASLRRQSEVVWSEIDCLVTPTAGTVFRIEEVLAEPVKRNSDLGYYTNSMNLLDLCGLAVPFGRFSFGVPFGVTLVAPAFRDEHLLAWGARFLAETVSNPPAAGAFPVCAERRVPIAVCGAHLSGLPLNHQLLERDGTLLSRTTTAATYRLYELPDTSPAKPGLVRVQGGGAAVEVEVWELPVSRYGDFVAEIPAPLGIGVIELADGSRVQGFLCEAAAISEARDITASGGWRNHLGRGSAGPV